MIQNYGDTMGTDSILTSIKKMLGIMEEYEHFDMDLTIHINTVLSILTQLGIGPSTGFSIIDETTTWSDWTSLPKDLELVKTYLFLRTRLLFDPPTSGSVASSYEDVIKELEWRMVTSMDSKKE